MEDWREHLIGGVWREGAGGEFESVDPFLQKPWARITAASASDMDDACVAGSRLLVHESIYHQVIERVVALAQGIKFGNPLDPATHETRDPFVMGTGR